MANGKGLKRIGIWFGIISASLILGGFGWDQIGSTVLRREQTKNNTFEISVLHRNEEERRNDVAEIKIMLHVIIRNLDLQKEVQEELEYYREKKSKVILRGRN